MSDQTDSLDSSGGRKALQANAVSRYEVTTADLPLCCPMDNMTRWDSHPRVFLPIEGRGEARCPYCGALYVLKEKIGEAS